MCSQIRRLRFSLSILVFFLIASQSHGTAEAITVSGVLADAATGDPIPSFKATYRLIREGEFFEREHLSHEGRVVFQTDTEGKFSFQLPGRGFLRIGLVGRESNTNYTRRFTQHDFWRGGVSEDIKDLVLPVTLLPEPFPDEVRPLSQEGSRWVADYRDTLPKSTVTGIVRDRTTGEVVPGVQVIQYRSRKNAYPMTDTAGHFTLGELPPGTYFFSAGPVASADGSERVGSVVIVPILAGESAEIELFIEAGIDPAAKLEPRSTKPGYGLGPAGVNSYVPDIEPGKSRVAPGCFQLMFAKPGQNAMSIVFFDR